MQPEQPVKCEAARPQVQLLIDERRRRVDSRRRINALRSSRRLCFHEFSLSISSPVSCPRNSAKVVQLRNAHSFAVALMSFKSFNVSNELRQPSLLENFILVHYSAFRCLKKNLRYIARAR